MMWRFSYGMPTKAGRISLFDLGFLEDDVLARNRIVFALFHLVSQGPRILASDVVISGIRAAHEADLDRIRLCHEKGSSSLVLNLAAHHSLREKSVKYSPRFLTFGDIGSRSGDGHRIDISIGQNQLRYLHIMRRLHVRWWAGSAAASGKMRQVRLRRESGHFGNFGRPSPVR